MTQKEIILNYLKSRGGWVKEYDLRSKDTPYGWIGFQGDRRTRELYRDGHLERRQMSGYAEFKYKEPIKSEVMCEQGSLI